VVSLQTHDQVGNRATGDRLSATVPAGLLACGAALLLTSPYTPMLFMGEEWGAGTPWQYFTDHTDPDIADAVREGRRSEFAAHGWDRSRVPDPQDPATVERSRLDWSELPRDPHRRLLEWYRCLVRLRRTVPDLHDDALDRVVVEQDDAAGTVRVTRGQHLVLVNLSDEPRALDADGRTPLVSWDAETRVAPDGTVQLPPQSVAIVGPAS
jgi:maltooligosyltrehalose trehalohydrolase